MKKIFQLFFVLFSATLLTACGYNEIQRLDEEVTAKQAQMLSVYKKRADLIPQLVETLKAETSFEKSTLESVMQSRARATQVTLPKDATPEQLQAFVEAQRDFGSGLSRLLAISENYPNLKSNTGFQELRQEVSKTENQIVAVRNQYIRSVQQYNTHIRKFPVNITAMIFSVSPKSTLQFEDVNLLQQPPKMHF